MTETELQAYLHEHIPLSQAMQAQVATLRPELVVLQAPLAPNINHRETVFGGSASALAILAGWSLVHVRLAGEGANARVVIQTSEMRYAAPMAATFTAHARFAEDADWERFVATLRRRRKARIAVSVELQSDGVAGGLMTGEFVALL